MKKINRYLAVALALALLLTGSGLPSMVQAEEMPDNGQEVTEQLPDNGQEITEQMSEADLPKDAASAVTDEKEESGTPEENNASQQNDQLENPDESNRKEEGGLLSIELSGGGAFNPGGAARELIVTFKPRKDGSGRRLEITGFDSAGLMVSEKPVVSGPITSTSFSGEKLTVNFANDFTVGTDISFRFSIKQSNEKNFATGVMEENGLYYGNGLTLTEYVNGVADQLTTSKIPVEYTMTETDLLSRMDSGYDDVITKFRDGMVLYTNAGSVEAPNGGGWQNKEAVYSLRPLKEDDWGNDYISPRFIRNLHIEIPLPPNVSYEGSGYEGGKNGIQISASPDKTYVYLDCAEYNPNSELKFTMKLNYTKIPPSGIAGALGINRWHDFWSNKTGVYARYQVGKPWKFTGDMYGIPQSKTFYDRSALILGTMIRTNYHYYASGNYNYSKKITNKEITLNIAAENDSSDEKYRTLMPQMNTFTDLDYIRRTTTEFEPQIRIKSVKRSGSEKGSGTMNITFYTNLGNRVTKPMDASVTAPEMQAGEYINKVTVDATGNRRGAYIFVADYMDVDLEGNPLAVGTVSRVKTNYEIVGYESMFPEHNNTSIATITYVESKIAEPIATRKIKRKVTYPFTSYDFAAGYNYKDINLLSVSNTGAEVGDIVNRNLTKVSVPPQAVTLVQAPDDREAFLPCQMLSSSPATLKLTGYTSDSLPDIKITYTTSAGNSGETMIPASGFSFSGSSGSAKVTINLPEGEVVNAIGCEISELPSWATVSLTLDNMEVPADILPSGRKTESMPLATESGGVCTTWNTGWHASDLKVYFTTPSGVAKEASQFDQVLLVAYWKIGVGFGESNYIASGNPDTARPAILQGAKTTINFTLADTAYNPTYGFEIDKNFNYIAGSFVEKSKKYKFIEEWLPNYFNDPADTEHYGNGLLRIRFIGSGDEAYNLFPILISTYSERYLSIPFAMTLQAKNQANPGTYRMIPMLYRSDKWAKENLVGKQMEIKNWKQGTDQMPETENQTPVYITNYEALFNDLRPISDHYDIDGDGDTSYMIRAVKPGSVFWNRPAYQQQITKQSTTNIRTYLIDTKTGDEIQDAELYPHQTVEFVQTMELLSAGNGTDFIGYYHIPKRHHKTDYADADGNKQTHTSEFDTYLTSFLTTTVDGTGIPPDAGLQVYYYLSPNPNDPASDDHNAMHELVDGQTDTSPNYKTQLQIEQMAVDQGVELKDILKNCTMIKIRADVIETRKSIVSKATLAIGHKEEGDKEKIHDYFSGQYRYTLDTGTRLPASYTSLTTLAMLPYVVGGTVFYDKDANSLASPLESEISGVAVELWQTGTDPHTGIPITDTLVDTQTSDANGRYGFTIAYHGDYFLKFKMSDGKKLSLKNQYGGFVYEQSVFDQVTEGGQDYAKATFSLNDHSLPYQNAGIVDARTLTVPEDIYISVGENAKLNYQITPNYLMDDQFFRITPDIVSDIANNEFFTVDGLHTLLTGVKEGTGTITVSIPDAPLDGTTYITKTVTVHVEPASVASVSVPAKAEIYAVQGKTNEVIAPELTVHNYSPDPVKAYIKRIDSNNTGAGKDLKLVKKKDSYDRDEISLNVIPVPRTNPFSALAKTDLTQVEYIKGGLPLGTMEGFHENSNWGKFTFDGEYNPVIILTNLEDNRFVMSYRFEKAGTP